jgi:hypothetical protein
MKHLQRSADVDCADAAGGKSHPANINPATKNLREIAVRGFGNKAISLRVRGNGWENYGWAKTTMKKGCGGRGLAIVYPKAC